MSRTAMVTLGFLAAAGLALCSGPSCDSIGDLDPRDRLERWRLDMKGPCMVALTKAGVGFSPTRYDRPRRECKISRPILLSATINGVTLRNSRGDAADLLVSCEMGRHLVRLSTIMKDNDLTSLGHWGTYNCRNIRGTNTLSNHALGNAIDVAWFATGPKNKAVVLTDFHDSSPQGRLLRDLADQLYAERVFNTILTPDFNADHANHFHLDLDADGNFFKQFIDPEAQDDDPAPVAILRGDSSGE